MAKIKSHDLVILRIFENLQIFWNFYSKWCLFGKFKFFTANLEYKLTLLNNSESAHVFFFFLRFKEWAEFGFGKDQGMQCSWLQFGQRNLKNYWRSDGSVLWGYRKMWTHICNVLPLNVETRNSIIGTTPRENRA